MLKNRWLELSPWDSMLTWALGCSVSLIKAKTLPSKGGDICFHLSYELSMFFCLKLIVELESKTRILKLLDTLYYVFMHFYSPIAHSTAQTYQCFSVFDLICSGCLERCSSKWAADKTFWQSVCKKRIRAASKRQSCQWIVYYLL